MVENLLKDLEVDEESLERNLYNIGEDSDWSIVGRHLFGAKKLAKTGLKLTSQNSFVGVSYVLDRDQTYVFPEFNPSKKISAVIRGYKPVFGGNCSLVLGEHKNKQFVFFDPEFKKRDYEALLSTSQQIRLAVISSGYSYNDVSSEVKENMSEEQVSEFLKNGYTKVNFTDGGGWRIPLYRTIFSAKKETKEEGNHYLLDVQNPLDPESEIELVTASREFQKPLEKIASDFYFIGKI